MYKDSSSVEYMIGMALGWVVYGHQTLSVEMDGDTLSSVGARPASLAEKAMWTALVQLASGEGALVWQSS